MTTKPDTNLPAAIAAQLERVETDRIEFLRARESLDDLLAKIERNEAGATAAEHDAEQQSQRWRGMLKEANGEVTTAIRKAQQEAHDFQALAKELRTFAETARADLAERRWRVHQARKGFEALQESTARTYAAHRLKVAFNATLETKAGKDLLAAVWAVLSDEGHEIGAEPRSYNRPAQSGDIAGRRLDRRKLAILQPLFDAAAAAAPDPVLARLREKIPRTPAEGDPRKMTLVKHHARKHAIG